MEQKELIQQSNAVKAEIRALRIAYNQHLADMKEVHEQCLLDLRNKMDDENKTYRIGNREAANAYYQQREELIRKCEEIDMMLADCKTAE
jgi:hypothetical protein